MTPPPRPQPAFKPVFHQDGRFTLEFQSFDIHDILARDAVLELALFMKLPNWDSKTSRGPDGNALTMRLGDHLIVVWRRPDGVVEITIDETPIHLNAETRIAAFMRSLSPNRIIGRPATP
ncbi:hypothetical protein HLH26_09010 [Gluconacetobacter sp. 1b LMG 1731]|uniref:Uncharacterized protein n=1 Tax=Gluconacetobacter dulcium TaxID=2729096 RepID=A0A7W4IKS3_9PROT|nr:hypothetical protein [Gluconacetobacter dulcium]MBB2164680.1 hypothetical protein [Gluconacetobacter dulcium]MBB2193816.1 hypothetical protein [Gluconacetobacter dulcium]